MEYQPTVRLLSPRRRRDSVRSFRVFRVALEQLLNNAQNQDVDEKCSDARRGFAAQESVCEESDEEEDEDVPETEEEAKRQATYQASWFSKLTGGACAALLLFECAELC